MPIIKIPKKDLEFILEGEMIGCEPGKHDCTYKNYIFDYECKKYSAWLEHSYNEGVQLWDDHIEATEVKQVEVMTKKWVPV